MIQLNPLIRLIEKISWRSGQWVSWLTSILVVIICFDVVFRYSFNSTRAWITELEWHLFAATFLIGSAYTFKENAHVRVDLFYSTLSPVRKAWINLLGCLFFLLPWCGIIVRAAYKYAMNSFRINETSPDPGGLPGRWLIKFVIVIGFTLLFLQGLAILFKSLQVIFGKRTYVFPEEKIEIE